MKINIDDIVKSFSPAWFATVMGTAVMPLCLSFLRVEIARHLAIFFFILGMLMFLIILVPWTISIIKFFRDTRKKLNHPVMVNFFPTMPISLVIFALVLMKFPQSLFPRDVSIHLANLFWWLGSLGILFFGFIIIFYIFKNTDIDPEHANFAWYIPPVSHLIIPVAGFELAHHFTAFNTFYFVFSLIAFGIGLFMFIFIGSIVFYRYVYEDLPIPVMGATFFIGMAPPAIISIILLKMMNITPQIAFLHAGKIFSPLMKMGIIINWGFAFWWFTIGLMIIFYYIYKKNFPFALSWWAFTFPLGALTVSTAVVFQITHVILFQWLYFVLLAFFLVIWLAIFAKTLSGVRSRKIFVPHH